MPSLPRADELMRVALVTGACSGIGNAVATRLASLGYELVVVSHRPRELEEAADGLRRAHGVVVHAVPLDLARPEAAAELHERCRSLDVEVDILVNNAGMLLYGDVVDTPPAAANALLQLHVVTPSLLATLFGRDMRARGRGHILVVSSISAWRDFPRIAYYGSSKRYLRSFTRALRTELAPHGVNVTCLAPGPTMTGLYDPNSVPVGTAERLGVMMDATSVADAGLRAMFAREAEHIPGLVARAMTFGAVLTPQRVIDLLQRYVPAMGKRGQ